MRIWVDADACPGPVRDIIIKAATRLSVEAVFVANKPLFLPVSHVVSFIKADAGPDAADQYIADHAQSGDLAVTQDIPLAAQLVPKQVVVVSPYGTLFTDANIGERHAVRNFLQGMRDTGMVTGGPRPFGDKEKRQFANAFDQTLTRLLRSG